MAACRQDIRWWLEEAEAQGATHMIVVCDTFSHENFPVYVQRGEDPRVKGRAYNTGMHRMEEVYDLSTDWKEQLASK